MQWSVESNTEQVICCKNHHNLFFLPVCKISNVFCRHKKYQSGKQSVALKSYKQKSHVIYEGCLLPKELICSLEVLEIVESSSIVWSIQLLLNPVGLKFMWLTQTVFETAPYSLSQILLSTALVLSWESQQTVEKSVPKVKYLICMKSQQSCSALWIKRKCQKQTVLCIF